ncbi:MAG: flagellar motor switch protein FliN [Nitrospirae bacterium]|nr:flagellar motor switch protein FliN [Nitrospirota bacterium]MBI3605501.1 flagellar motor switch protein FliN [Nitrospirota bacterium]
MANETGNGPAKPAIEKKTNPPAGEVKSAAFSPIQDNKTGEAMKNIDFILDVPLKVSVVLGSVRMMIRDLLQLGQGSVVELDKLAGEAMEVHIGDKLIARGEVVVVNDKFGIRLTDIVSPTERIKQLNK